MHTYCFPRALTARQAQTLELLIGYRRGAQLSVRDADSVVVGCVAEPRDFEDFLPRHLVAYCFVPHEQQGNGDESTALRQA